MNLRVDSAVMEVTDQQGPEPSAKSVDSGRVPMPRCHGLWGHGLTPIRASGAALAADPGVVRPARGHTPEGWPCCTAPASALGLGASRHPYPQRNSVLPPFYVTKETSGPKRAPGN